MAGNYDVPTQQDSQSASAQNRSGNNLDLWPRVTKLMGGPHQDMLAVTSSPPEAIPPPHEADGWRYWKRRK
eukprot:5629263-Prorocentrum_lima.AAC.1